MNIIYEHTIMTDVHNWFYFVVPVWSYSASADWLLIWHCTLVPLHSLGDMSRFTKNEIFTMLFLLVLVTDQLIPLMCERAGYPPNTRLAIFEVIFYTLCMKSSNCSLACSRLSRSNQWRKRDGHCCESRVKTHLTALPFYGFLLIIQNVGR